MSKNKDAEMARQMSEMVCESLGLNMEVAQDLFDKADKLLAEGVIHVCEKCGDEVEDSCAKHPRATVLSITED